MLFRKITLQLLLKPSLQLPHKIVHENTGICRGRRRRRRIDMRICSYRSSFKGGMRRGGVKHVAWMLLLLMLLMLVVDVIVMRRRLEWRWRRRV